MTLPLLLPRVTCIIYVVRNNDAYSEPVKIVVNFMYYRNLEQLFVYITNRLSLPNVVRTLYSKDGQAVKSIESLLQGMTYVVCCGHETFKPATFIGHKKVSNSNLSLKPRSNSIKTDKESPLFTSQGKSYRVIIFRNGDDKHKGNVLYLNHRNCRTWDQFMEEVSKAVPNRTVGVRNLHDASSGQLITKWSDINDGMNIVAAGSEAFQHKQYGLVPKEVLDKSHHIDPASNPYHVDFSHRHSKSNAEIPKLITVYPNGDPYHMGFNVSVSAIRFPYIDKLLDFINNHVTWNSIGVGKKLIRLPDGYRIKFINEIQQQGQYVLVNEIDNFINIKYNINAWVPLERLTSNSTFESVQLQPIRMKESSSRPKTKAKNSMIKQYEKKPIIFHRKNQELLDTAKPKEEKYEFEGNIIPDTPEVVINPNLEKEFEALLKRQEKDKAKNEAKAKKMQPPGRSEEQSRRKDLVMKEIVAHYDTHVKSYSKDMQSKYKDVVKREEPPSTIAIINETKFANVLDKNKEDPLLDTNPVQEETNHHEEKKREAKEANKEAVMEAKAETEPKETNKEAVIPNEEKVIVSEPVAEKNETSSSTAEPKTEIPIEVTAIQVTNDDRKEPTIVQNIQVAKEAIIVEQNIQPANEIKNESADIKTDAENDSSKTTVVVTSNDDQKPSDVVDMKNFEGNNTVEEESIPTLQNDASTDKALV